MKLIKKIIMITTIALLLATFWPGKAYAEGGAYVSDTYLEDGPQFRESTCHLITKITSQG